MKRPQVLHIQKVKAILDFLDRHDIKALIDGMCKSFADGIEEIRVRATSILVNHKI
jgi:hypothetical protein